MQLQRVGHNWVTFTHFTSPDGFLVTLYCGRHAVEVVSHTGSLSQGGEPVVISFIRRRILSKQGEERCTHICIQREILIHSTLHNIYILCIMGCVLTNSLQVPWAWKEAHICLLFLVPIYLTLILTHSVSGVHHNTVQTLLLQPQLLANQKIHLPTRWHSFSCLGATQLTEWSGKRAEG